MTSECECVATQYPFTCLRMGRVMNVHEHAICAGCFQHSTPREAYLEAWRRAAAAAPPLDPANAPPPALIRGTAAKRNNSTTETPHADGPTKLTIGMAVYDDYDGWYFSLQSIRLHHREILDRLRFVIVDNRPQSAEGRAIAGKIRGYDDQGNPRASDGGGWIANARYIPMPEIVGTSAVRDRIFQEADTEAVLVIDSHVLIDNGVLARLLAWFDDNPDSVDLLQGPMLDDAIPSVHATQMTAEWGSDLMFGRWSTDVELTRPDAPAKEIPLHGLGLFACRRDAWPGFPPHLRGFGGEEGNIHDAFRQRGGRVLCLPFLRWLHRFDRPRNNGRPAYPCNLEDKARNYLIWARWLSKGAATRADIVERFGKRLGRPAVEKIAAEVDGLPIGTLPPLARKTIDSPSPLPCRHRGKFKKERYCKPCKSRTGKGEWVPVSHCAVHGQCSPEQSGLADVRGCNVCEDRTTEIPQMVSVLIVTHGRFQLLRRALRCFLDQTHAPREMLILNHHPRPLTYSRVASADAPRIQIFNEPNERLFGENLNRLLPEARGEFVCTWGDDDLYLPWFLSMAVQKIGVRPAWKPEISWHYHGVDDAISRVGNTLEASIVWRGDYVRRHGFANGDTEAESLFANLGGPVPSEDVGIWSPFLTTWATGHHHLSGGIGRGTAAERHAIWRDRNQDDGGGEPLTPADVAPWWSKLQSQIPIADWPAWARKAGLP